MARRPSKPTPMPTWHASSVWTCMGFAALLLVTIGMRRLPAWVAAGYALLSLLCFAVYAWDKRAARRGAWRVPESQLLWLGLLGGWPGAVLAQEMLRHKSSKLSFRAWFWLSVGVNVAAFAALLPLRPLLWPLFKRQLGL